MDVLTIILLAWAMCATYIIVKLLKRLDAVESDNFSTKQAMRKYGKDISDIGGKLNTLCEKFEACSELIAATEEYTKEAANREKLMQDGINAIMGYDAMAAITNTGGDNG